MFYLYKEKNGLPFTLNGKYINFQDILSKPHANYPFNKLKLLFVPFCLVEIYERLSLLCIFNWALTGD